MKRGGWLLNDQLMTIPGTQTMFSLLCGHIPNLQPILGNFRILHRRYYKYAQRHPPPQYIVRNASYFEPVTTGPKIREIAFLQDPMDQGEKIKGPRPRGRQVAVCEGADVVVCNSHAMRDELMEHATPKRVEVIQIGVDFGLFTHGAVKKRIDVLYVGSDAPIKGWDRMLGLIHANPQWQYAVVLKRSVAMDVLCELTAAGNVEVHTKIPWTELVGVMQQSRLLVCTSRRETLHMAGVEAGACGVPAVAMDVGIYKDREDGLWGMRTTPETLSHTVGEAMDNLDKFNPRWYWLDAGMDVETCMRQWRELINE